jgi:hypothetical protein
MSYPLATVIRYGPDDRTATKIAVAILNEPDAEPIMRRWVATGIDHDPKIQAEIKEFIQSHGVRKVVAAPEIMGCPHEEGEDFPDGEDCPFCPFWRGKQGTARRD